MSISNDEVKDYTDLLKYLNKNKEILLSDFPEYISNKIIKKFGITLEFTGNFSETGGDTHDGDNFYAVFKISGKDTYFGLLGYYSSWNGRSSDSCFEEVVSHKEPISFFVPTSNINIDEDSIMFKIINHLVANTDISDLLDDEEAIENELDVIETNFSKKGVLEGRFSVDGGSIGDGSEFYEVIKFEDFCIGVSGNYSSSNGSSLNGDYEIGTLEAGLLSYFVPKVSSV